MGQIRGLISSGDISFPNGISEQDIKMLNQLPDNVLRQLANKEITFREMIVQKVSNGDEFALRYVNNNPNFKERLEDTQAILNNFKEKNGKSLYKSIIDKYKNGSNRNLIKHFAQELLSLCVIEKHAYDKKATSDIDREANDLLDRLLDSPDDVSIEELENFDFDKYEEEIMSYRFDWTKKKMDIDNEEITNPAIKEKLPKIETSRISENKISQKINGKEYEIEYNGDSIKILDKKTNKPYVIDMEKLIEQISLDDATEEEIKEFAEERELVKNLIRQMPATVLIDLSIESKKIRIGYDSSKEGAVELARFDQRDQSIIINMYNKDSLTSNDLTHEVGHALSQIKYKSYNANHSSIDHDEKFKKIFNTELEVLQKAPDFEVQYAAKNYEEMFAECYTLLNTGTCSSNHVISKYFPKSLEYIQNKIEELRKLPEKKRYLETNEYVL